MNEYCAGTQFFHCFKSDEKKEKKKNYSICTVCKSKYEKIFNKGLCDDVIEYLKDGNTLDSFSFIREDFKKLALANFHQKQPAVIIFLNKYCRESTIVESYTANNDDDDDLIANLNGLAIKASSEKKLIIPLPPTYQKLLKLFVGVEVVLNYTISQNVTAIFHKIKDSVERQAKCSFSTDSFAQIVTIYPEAFKLTSIGVMINDKKVQSFTIELFSDPISEKFLSTLDRTPQGVTFGPRVTCKTNILDEKGKMMDAIKKLGDQSLSRRLEFKKRLEKRVLVLHEAFLNEKELQWSISSNNFTLHPDFNLSTIPNIEKAELPIKKVVPSHQASKNKSAAFNESLKKKTLTVPVAEALVKESNSGKEITNKENNPSNSSNSSNTGKMLTREQALLERVRERQRLKEEEAKANPKASSEMVKRRSMLSRARAIASSLFNHVNSNGKSVLAMSDAISHLQYSFPNFFLSSDQWYEHIDFLAEIVPTFCSKEVIIACSHLSTSRMTSQHYMLRFHDTSRMKTVIDTIESLIDSKKMIGRNAERKIITDFLLENINNSQSGEIKNHSGALYISGLPGTGKSALVNEIIQSQSESFSAKSSKKKPIFTFINCMAFTSKTIFKHLVKEFGLKDDTQEDLIALREFVIRSGPAVILILDEIDNLVSKYQDVLYNFFELANNPGSRLCLIGIANTLDLTSRFLPRLKAKNFNPMHLSFPPYKSKEFYKILQFWLYSQPFVFNTKAVEYTARNVPGDDIRQAFNVCRLAAAAGNSEVTILDVQKVLKNMSKQYSLDSRVESLNSLPKMVLVVLALTVKVNGITAVGLYRNYRDVVEKHSRTIECASSSQFQDSLGQLEVSGLIQYSTRKGNEVLGLCAPVKEVLELLRKSHFLKSIIDSF